MEPRRAGRWARIRLRRSGTTRQSPVTKEVEFSIMEWRSKVLEAASRATSLGTRSRPCISYGKSGGSGRLGNGGAGSGLPAFEESRGRDMEILGIPISGSSGRPLTTAKAARALETKSATSGPAFLTNTGSAGKSRRIWVAKEPNSSASNRPRGGQPVGPRAARGGPFSLHGVDP